MPDVKRVIATVATKASAAIKGTGTALTKAAGIASKAAGATTTVVSIASSIDTKSLILVQHGDKVLLIDADVGAVIAELQINTDLLHKPYSQPYQQQKIPIPHQQPQMEQPQPEPQPKPQPQMNMQHQPQEQPKYRQRYRHNRHGKQP